MTLKQKVDFMWATDAVLLRELNKLIQRVEKLEKKSATAKMAQKRRKK
jgi:hypothetical protein